MNVRFTPTGSLCRYNLPRAGVNLNDDFGGGDLIESNLIANCVRESGDHGPINSWSRMPWVACFSPAPFLPNTVCGNGEDCVRGPVCCEGWQPMTHERTPGLVELSRYITTIRNGTASILPKPRTITRNMIIGTYSSQECIDNDDGSAWSVQARPTSTC